MNLSYKTKMRLWSMLHPIRTYKAWYFMNYIEHTDKWRTLIDTNPKKAFEMKWVPTTLKNSMAAAFLASFIKKSFKSLSPQSNAGST